MRILVTGGGGQLGRELTVTSSPHEIVAVTRAECNICDAKDVARQLDSGNFDAVINTASYTRVDAAETDADAAHEANVAGPGVVAAACAERGILVCHLSTDFVFDGRASAPIAEDAQPAPLSVYGRTKLAGESEVRRVSSRHQIVRTSWLYGQDGPNFPLTMLRLARERGELRVVSDQRGAPTWTGHLAPAILRLVELGTPGTYHLTNGGDTTWHGFATEVMRQAGLDVPVIPITTADYPTPAMRPAYSVLDNRAWRALGEPALPHWRNGVKAYVGALHPGGPGVSARSTPYHA